MVARELGTDRVLWTRPASGKAGAALTPYAAVVADEKPSRLVAVDPRSGRELAVLRTPANALAVGPQGMIVGEGREIGYVRFGAIGAAPGVPPGSGGIPGPGGTGPAPEGDDNCGPKRELCDDPAGGKDG